MSSYIVSWITEQWKARQKARSSRVPNTNSRFASSPRDSQGRPLGINHQGKVVPVQRTGTMQAQDSRPPGIPGIPSSAGFAPGQGAEFQRRLQEKPKPSFATPPGGGWRDTGRSAPLAPQQSSGRSIPRAVIQADGTATPVPPATPSFGGAGFNPLAAPGSLSYNPAELQKELATGGGWTNAGLVAGLQTDLNPIVKDTFTSDQLTPFTTASFGAPGQSAPASPVAALPEFQMAGSLLGSPLTGELLNAPTPGVTNAVSVTPESVVVAAPEVDAQSMASDAVNQVMSLQNRIRENRGMPLIVE